MTEQWHQDCYVSSKFYRNPFSGFGATGNLNLPFPIDCIGQWLIQQHVGYYGTSRKKPWYLHSNRISANGTPVQDSWSKTEISTYVTDIFNLSFDNIINQQKIMWMSKYVIGTVICHTRLKSSVSDFRMNNTYCLVNEIDLCAVFEILTLICQKIETSRDLDNARRGKVCHHVTNASRANPCTKFDNSIFSLSGEI